MNLPQHLAFINAHRSLIDLAEALGPEDPFLPTVHTQRAKLESEYRSRADGDAVISLGLEEE